MTKLILDMVDVPEGSFLMGADESKEYDSDYEERPEREVWLSAYKIQKTPVTVGQWQEFLRATNYSWDFLEQALQQSPSPMHPITYVSWFDACEFVKWLQETLGEDYNLPTEAQWEKACRGQYGQLFPWGNQERDWMDQIDIYSETKVPVGSCSDCESPYGCLDMWQNVCEWCLDWFDSGDYTHDPSVAWINPTGISSGEWKVLRGGNPLSSGWPRCTYRGVGKPNEHHLVIGFRVVLNHPNS